MPSIKMRDSGVQNISIMTIKISDIPHGLRLSPCMDTTNIKIHYFGMHRKTQSNSYYQKNKISFSMHFAQLNLNTISISQPPFLLKNVLWKLLILQVRIWHYGEN